MNFDLGVECACVLAELPEQLPDHSKPRLHKSSELNQYRQQAAVLLTELQKSFPALKNSKLGGVNRLYVFEPKAFIETLEIDVVKHWLEKPESLNLTAGQIARLASSWYDQPVSEHRIKRRFRTSGMIQRLQSLCYEHGNATSISGCNSLTHVQKRLRLRALQCSDKWTFRGDITFFANGTITIGDNLAQQDCTAGGKRRVRGNGSAVAVEALRNVLLAHS